MVFTLVIGFVPDSGLKAILGHTSSQAASSSKSRDNLGTSLVELVENQSENHLRFRLENHLQLTRDDFFSCHFFWFPEEPSHPNVQVGRKSERLDQAQRPSGPAFVLG